MDDYLSLTQYNDIIHTHINLSLTQNSLTTKSFLHEKINNDTDFFDFGNKQCTKHHKHHNHHTHKNFPRKKNCKKSSRPKLVLVKIN